MVYIAALEIPIAMLIYPFRAPQVLDDPILAALQLDKALIEILTEYSDYADVFSSNLAIKLFENNKMNEYAIELIEEKQLAYRPIYTLRPVELETLKAYIKTHLKTGFIRPSKSPAGAPILFDKKLDGSLCLCVNY